MGFFSRKVEKKRSLGDIVAKTNKSQDAILDEWHFDGEGDEELEFDDGFDVEFEQKPKRNNKKKVKEDIEELGELDPLDCFFMKNENSEKWLLRLAKWWHYVISVVWFFIGALTFAPVIYMSRKSLPIFKDKKKSLICGIAIYALIVILIALIFIL